MNLDVLGRQGENLQILTNSKPTNILCVFLQSATSGTCTVSTISNWAADISAFIKSIDTNHLVAIGDEGFFNDPGNPIYVYQYVLYSMYHMAV